MSIKLAYLYCVSLDIEIGRENSGRAIRKLICENEIRVISTAGERVNEFTFDEEINDQSKWQKTLTKKRGPLECLYIAITPKAVATTAGCAMRPLEVV